MVRAGATRRWSLRDPCAIIGVILTERIKSVRAGVLTSLEKELPGGSQCVWLSLGQPHFSTSLSAPFSGKVGGSLARRVGAPSPDAACLRQGALCKPNVPSEPPPCCPSLECVLNAPGGSWGKCLDTPTPVGAPVQPPPAAPPSPPPNGDAPDCIPLGADCGPFTAGACCNGPLTGELILGREELEWSGTCLIFANGCLQDRGPLCWTCTKAPF